MTWTAPAQINLTNATATASSFSGGGVAYNAVSITGGGTGAFTIAGSNSFTALTINAPKSVVFTSGTTQTVSPGGFTATGSSGNVITITASTPGTAATISVASGTVSCDWLSLKDSTATGGAGFFTGHNSVNVSGNTGWNFFAVPVTRTGADSVSVSDGASRGVALARATSESVSVSDSAARSRSGARSGAESVAVSDSAARAVAAPRSGGESKRPKLSWRSS